MTGLSTQPQGQPNDSDASGPEMSRRQEALPNCDALISNWGHYPEAPAGLDADGKEVCGEVDLSSLKERSLSRGVPEAPLAVGHA